MDPITINFEGLTFGSGGYIVATAVAGTIFGLISWWQANAAGRCFASGEKGDNKKGMEGNCHLANAIISGLLGIVTVCVALQMTYEMFQHALNGTIPQ